jgi:hypothetical protein
MLRSPPAPIHAFDMIGQNCARHGASNDHFERVIFYLRGHRATYHQVRLGVVDGWAEYQCGPMSGLFSSGLWIEV